MSKKAIAARKQEFQALLKQHGGNCREFATATGYSWGTMRQWKCGARVPSRHTLRTMKLFLNQPTAA